MDWALRTHGLTKYYGQLFRRKLGVKDLNLTVRRGEVFGYLGPNGAGKSTTLRLLLDLIRPTRGRADVLGLDPRRNGQELRRRLGYLPGELALEARLTGSELLTWFANLRGGTELTYAHELAERFDLDLTRPLRTLSKGNRQKLGLIQAFMHRPELLVLDEPTSGLDPLVRKEVFELVRECRAEGQTFLLSSHRMDEVEALADRVGILRDGELILVEEIDVLKARAVRHLEIHFAGPPNAEYFSGLSGLRELQINGSIARFQIEGSLDELIKTAARFEVLNITNTAADLGAIFLSYYEDPGGKSHDAA